MQAAAIAVLSAKPDRRAWYLVVTNTGQERNAVHHMRRLGVEVYLPLRQSILAGPARHVGSKPLFPRYLFIHVDPVGCEWWAIRSAPGVKALVSRGERPAALPMGFVETVKAHEVGGLVAVEKMVAQAEKAANAELRAGQKVRADLAGQMWDAIVEERLDANRVRILLSGVGGNLPARVIARRAQLQS